MEITKSLCAITAEIGALGKTKKNQQQGYAFRGVDDLMNLKIIHYETAHL